MPPEAFKILHIVLNLDVGGGQEMVRTLAKFQKLQGHIPYVCSYQDGPLRAEIENEGIIVELLPDRRYSILALPFFIQDMARMRGELVKIIRKYEIDVIQTHLLQSMDFLVATLRRRKRTPLVFWTVQNSNFMLQERNLPRYKWLLSTKRLLYRLLYRLVIQWINGFIAVSEDVRKSLLDKIGDMDDKITVVCNAIDFDRFQKPAHLSRALEDLKLEPEGKTLVVVARLTEQKGHRYLIDALPKLAARFPGLKVLFLGEGELKEALTCQAEALGMSDSIHFLGNRKDVAEILAASDIFVLPSLWEGLPLALIEAMASGLPAVATDVSGSRQVIIDRLTGLLVPPGDAPALAEAIGTLLENPDLARQMALAGQKHVEMLHHARKQASDYIALYQREWQLSHRQETKPFTR